MTRKAVVIEPGYANYDLEREILGPLGFEIVTCDGAGDRAALEAAVTDAEIIFVRDTPVDGGLISKMESARGLIRYGIGVDHIDLTAAKAMGIIVARVNDYGADIEVADHTVALLLAAVRRIVSRDRDVRNGAWQVGQDEPIRRIAGSTIGFLGYGRIARAVETRMRGFGVDNFIAYDPFLKTSTSAELVGLKELAERSDVLTLHAPATEENTGIINQDFLERMQPHAILVNTARGLLIDEAALADAVESGRVRAAALDVFTTEPPRGNPLFGVDGITLSDHSAWYSEGTVAAIQRGAALQAKQIAEGEEPDFRVA
ncbi:C-terminal binding protein [Lentibacter sp. XHP0401]|uniref:C-terminal binding protein n=1 Tax=Lentibacter sp. XHP0401 TaxID=2984334 RepID=UPI0021E921A2|nr:C-terminal binding protein [Lentibacter sp. XHP0401]MCV2894653.1 C-terminal binding protein [Lentibacter sp. XHP0401]